MVGLCWVLLIPFCICEHAAVAYVAGTGGLGKQVHCFAMSCCDLAMDEGVSTNTQPVTLCISDLLCGA